MTDDAREEITVVLNIPMTGTGQDEIDVLCYYDGPMIYARHLPDGRIIYHHWIDGEGTFDVFAAVEISTEELSGLKAGMLDIRGRFDDRPIWCHRDDGALEPWQVDDDFLPDRGVTLRPPGA